MNIMRNLLFIITVIVSVTTKAQTFEIGISGNTPIVIGDLTETNIDNSSSGYVSIFVW